MLRAVETLIFFQSTSPESVTVFQVSWTQLRCCLFQETFRVKGNFSIELKRERIDVNNKLLCVFLKGNFLMKRDHHWVENDLYPVAELIFCLVISR